MSACADLCSVAQQVLGHIDVSAGGSAVQGGVASLVLTALI